MCVLLVMSDAWYCVVYLNVSINTHEQVWSWKKKAELYSEVGDMDTVRTEHAPNRVHNDWS